MTVRIINSDVMDGLRQIPDESVNCVVTSPPYWGLRDYGVAGQIGLEKTPAEFVSRMVEVFREVRRVLRSDGVCFVNLGDSYAGGGTIGRNDTTPERLAERAALFGTGTGAGSSVGASGHRPRADGLKPKDLCGIPWRVAFALQDDGWWLRQDIIWHKPNPMPESVTDRCTKTHEYVFLLTKAERYFYDAEAIRETAVAANAGAFDGGPQRNRDGSNANDGRNFRGKVKVPGGWDRGPGSHGTIHREGRTAAEYQEAEVKFGRNKRSVWTIATNPFPEAHFATFPPELPEICIKAGCPKGGTVLDPFGGAGTTGLVADRLQRNAVLIELNPTYAAMAQRRLANDAGGLFANEAVSPPEPKLQQLNLLEDA